MAGRRAIAASLLLVVAAAAAASRGGSGMGSFSRDGLIEPVPVRDVRLAPDSRFDKAVSLNREYLLGLDTDRLLKTFRMNAGLDAPGDAFSGSWEDPGCEVRGQYMGHWLSGTAVLGNYSGDRAVLDAASRVVDALHEVQQALPGGYLSAFPTEHFDRLRRLESVWAPFYVIHKIMAGLLDQWLFLGSAKALRMVTAEAAFFEAYIADILAKEGRGHWTQMLETEYGGMEEVLQNLYGATGDARWAKMASYFTKPNFYGPLTQGVDTLPNRHANTHLAQVNGFAAAFEKSGDRDKLAAVAHFFAIVTGAHSYATGGNNDGEAWQAPHELGPGIYGDGAGRGTEETCTTYNMMKVARYLFRWSGESIYFDYYERAVLNGMLGTQRMPAGYRAGRPVPPLQASRRPALAAEPRTASAAANWTAPALPFGADWRQQAFARFPGPGNGLPEWSNAPGPGVILYLLPLGAGNTKDDSWHHWATPLNSFWCCSGSTSEQFGRLMDSIYLERQANGSAPELFIAQLTPSSLAWRLGGLRIALNASLLPADGVARVSLSVDPLDSGSSSGGGGSGSGSGSSSGSDREAVLKLRIPGWANATGASARLNGGEEAADSLTPGAFLSLRRRWQAGDRLEVALPLTVRTEAIDDWRPNFKSVQAVLLGPFLMAALTDHDRTLQADPARIASYVRQAPAGGFRSLAAPDGRLLCAAKGGGLRLTPRERVLSGLDCSFRLLRRGPAADEALSPVESLPAAASLVLESMAQPGHLLTADAAGRLAMRRLPASAALPASLAAANGNHSLTLAGAAETLGLASDAFTVTAAVGAYPEGARLLAGVDRSYIIAPLGHIVEERYSPYLEFQPPPAAAAAFAAA